MKGIKKVVLEESMEISKGQNYRKSEGLCRNTANPSHAPPKYSRFSRQVIKGVSTGRWNWMAD